MFIGRFETFRFTAGADLTVDSVVTCGRFIGVTKEPVASGDVGLAFTSGPFSVFRLPLASAAASAVAAGTEVQIDSNGAVVYSGGTVIGQLFNAVASGDTSCDVAFYGIAPQAIPTLPVADNVACADDADAAAVRTALISLLSNLESSGQMAAAD